MRRQRACHAVPLLAVIAAFLTQAPLRADAGSNDTAGNEAPLAAPEVEKNPPPALTIDTWQPKAATPAATAAPEAETPPPPADETNNPKNANETDSNKNIPANLPGLSEPKTTVPAAPEHPPAAPRATMNEMTGVLTSIDTEERTIRLTVEGGITPQLGFDEATVVAFRGHALKISDLKTGDRVVARYIGKDLTAREIEKLPAKN